MEDIAAQQDVRRSFSWKWVVLGVVIVGLLVTRSLLPIGEWIKAFNAWVGQMGPAGMAIYAGVYVLATVLFLPGSPLTVGSGFLFGVVWGTAVVSVGSTLGASLAFLVARYLARDRVAAKAEQNERFKAIDTAIGRQGWKIVGLLRLSPAIPFNLSNYLYGLTAVKFWPYVLVSWLGMLPGTVMYVYLGAVGRVAAEGGQGRTPLEYALFGVGFLATVAVTILITRTAQKAVREAEVKMQERPVRSPCVR